MDVEGGEKFNIIKQPQYRVLGCQECHFPRRKTKVKEFRLHSCQSPTILEQEMEVLL